MIRPKPMNKVLLFGPKNYMKAVIEELYALNAVHIEDFTKKADEEVFDIGAPLEQNEKYAELLVKIRALISNLKIKKEAVKATDLELGEIKDKVEDISEDASSLLTLKAYYQSILTAYKKKEVERSLDLLKVEEKDYSRYMHYVGFINAKEETLREELSKVSGDFHLYFSNFEGMGLIALFIDKKADAVLDSHQFSPIDNPLFKKHFEVDSKSGVKFVKMDQQAEVAEKRLADASDRIDKLAKDGKELLLSAEKRLVIATDKAEAPLRMATTKNTFIVRGFIPVENTKKLNSQIERITDGKVMVHVTQPGHHENVPVAFNHPKIVEPFEAFMELYTLPSYREIDPTFFMFLTFPIFFGFMLGDVGYGIITLILFLVLKAKMPSAKNFLNAFIIASVASIFFGLMFGEYFGFEAMPASVGRSLTESLPASVVHALHMTPHAPGEETKEAGTGEPESPSEGAASPEATPSEKVVEPTPGQTHESAAEGDLVYPTPKIFSRGEQINDLLSMAVLFGIVHILIGYIIGFINVYNMHGMKFAILEKGGWILIMPMIVWLLLNYLNVITGFVGELLKPILPPLPVVGALFGIGALLVIIGEGVTGAIEVMFFSLMSNILSYARLMAVGLASLSLAVVVNDLAGQMFRSGAVGVIGGILVLLLGHTINIALGILSPFLHSLRLHYVEFFNKFFKGGGKKFRSFGYSE